jgi:hypothetical protein
MATARQRSEWDRAAALVAKLHNVNCSKRSDMIRDASALNPFRKRGDRLRVSVAELREAQTGRKGPLG